MLALPGHVKYIIERLEQAGFEAYAVGGCVRDGLLGRTPEDWDITTSARPKEVKALFKRTIDTGIQHGTVTVLMPAERTAALSSAKDGEFRSGGQPHAAVSRWEGYEVTTYRIDGAYLDSRHPSEVIFTPSLHEDLARRDFTINAMAVNERSGVVDDFGGLEDLEKRRIRAVGDPEKRFTEDALRMLRALRFSAQLDFEIDPATWAAVQQLAPRLQMVSKERINAELTKLLMSAHPERIGLVFESGLDLYVSPHFSKARAAWMPAGLPHEKYVRWGTFLRTVPEDARCILRELKMDNAVTAQAAAVAKLMSGELPDSRYEIRKKLSEYGFELYVNFLQAALCLTDAVAMEAEEGSGEKLSSPEGLSTDAAQTSDEASAERISKLRFLQAEVKAIRAAGDCIDLKSLRISGQDLLELGIPKGPKLGRILQLLMSEVLEKPSRNTREFLLESAREHARMP